MRVRFRSDQRDHPNTRAFGAPACIGNTSTCRLRNTVRRWCIVAFPPACLQTPCLCGRRGHIADLRFPNGDRGATKIHRRTESTSIVQPLALLRLQRSSLMRSRTGLDSPLALSTPSLAQGRVSLPASIRRHASGGGEHSVNAGHVRQARVLHHHHGQLFRLLPCKW